MYCERPQSSGLQWAKEQLDQRYSIDVWERKVLRRIFGEVREKEDRRWRADNIVAIQCIRDHPNLYELHGKMSGSLKSNER